MPFAQQHYPFSISEEDFAKKFPGDFIAEGLDQTRGWFYTLNVLATALKEDTPYKNLIVNGLVLAEDGSKMSKSKKNYPDPMYMIDQYSADAIKLYMLNSPLVRAEPLKFKEQGAKDIVKDVFLPWYNSYRFLIQNITRWEETTGKNFAFDESRRHSATNLLDKWIISASQELLTSFRTEMENYRLYTIVAQLLKFLDDLTKWYIRLNRSRMKGELGEEEMHQSLNTLFDVLFQTTLMMSCFTPFISEFMYLNLRNGFKEGSDFNKESIHFLQIPKADDSLKDREVVQAVENMQKVVELARLIRERNNIPIKKPVTSMKIVNNNPEFIKGLKIFEDYIKEEVNTMNLGEELNEDEFIQYTVDYDQRALGRRLKKEWKGLRPKLSTLTNDQIKEYMEKNTLDIDGIEIMEGELIPCKNFNEKIQNDETWKGAADKEFAVLLDTTFTDEIEAAYIAREYLGTIQKLRKEAKLEIDDDIEIFYSGETDKLIAALNTHKNMIKEKVKKRYICATQKPSAYPVITSCEFVSGD